MKSTLCWVPDESKLAVPGEGWTDRQTDGFSAYIEDRDKKRTLKQQQLNI